MAQQVFFHLMIAMGVSRSVAMHEKFWRPVIGILTQPSGLHDGHDFLAASYAKWVESGGGRAVPVPYSNSSKNGTLVLFSKLNGLLIPGGIEVYMHGETPGRWLFEAALVANQEGDHFPIWGTCGGFESLVMFASGDDDILERGFDAHDLSLPLQWTGEANTSRFISGLPRDVVAALGDVSDPITANWHDKGIGPARWRDHQKLLNFFRVISASYDRNGRKFISTLEAYAAPIYATQWHPEKAPFEGAPPDVGYEGLNYGPRAILASQALANFFVGEARQSLHRFPMEELSHALLFNWSPQRIRELNEYQQVYLFNWTDGSAAEALVSI